MAQLFDLKSYARRGAVVRLEELRDEMKSIYAVFPDLRNGNSSPANGAIGPRRRRRRMSAAEKRAVSARMKKYWAERRKAKK